jgi:oligopeptide/dipeptide ABC transporter ATP-binding protein
MSQNIQRAGSAPILDFQGVVKRFHVRQTWTRRAVVTALNGLSFRVEAGRTVALVGESGCGKSTAGRILLGLMEADDGAIYFQGAVLREVLARAPDTYRRAVQIVFQNPLASFNPMLNIGATLADAMRLRKELNTAQRRAEIVRLLEVVGLDGSYAQRYPADMSGGQLQRVSVARALASNPKVIFLDEPTSALDMSIRGQIVNLLQDLQAEYNIAYVLVSHDLTVVRAMAHYIHVMYLGEVVEEGPVDTILENPRHPYTQALLSATLLGRIDGEQIAPAAQVRGEVLQLPPDYHGCKLTRRCPMELPACREFAQRLEAVSAGHYARCWRVTSEGETHTESSLGGESAGEEYAQKKAEQGEAS